MKNNRPEKQERTPPQTQPQTPPRPVHLLLIEDNPDLLANLYAFFEPSGYALDSARDGATGLTFAAQGNYDVIVLDLMLPRLDGLTLCRRLRHDHHCATPVLMLTARDQIEDRIRGLEEGADDYLVKPFSLAELEARIKALVRRAQGRQTLGTLQWEDLRVDVRAPQAERRGKTIPLTPTEHRLLLCLLRRAPEVVPRRQLEQELWGENPPESDALRTHIHALRQRIDKGCEPALIETVHGVGFRLRRP